MSGDKCGKNYDAYSGAGGPDCGKKSSSGGYLYFFCEPGDYCESSSLRRCRTYENPQLGDLYHAYTGAGGPDCGKQSTSSGYKYYFCKPGDYCESSSLKRCSFVGTTCDSRYHAYSGGGGPECGKQSTSSGYKYFFCQPGDYCESSSLKRCLVRTSCPAPATYHAYSSAGGPQCGKKSTSVGYQYFYCKPGDSCKSSSLKRCST
jgi:hypothetical protein